MELSGGEDGTELDPLGRTRAKWEASMLAQLDPLRARLRLEPPARVARRSGAEAHASGLTLAYWGEDVVVDWPELIPYHRGGLAWTTFDSAMILYYLSQADGEPPSGKWVGFRELPQGAFYHQAFQSYSGDSLCRGFEDRPEMLGRSAAALEGWPVVDLGDHAYAFKPLPLVRLAVVLWLGDDEVPSRAAVLFDEGASHHLPTDGLALLGSGLTRRLLAQAERGRIGQRT